jgi:hypothetical protein
VHGLRSFKSLIVTVVLSHIELATANFNLNAKTARYAKNVRLGMDRDEELHHIPAIPRVQQVRRIRTLSIMMRMNSSRMPNAAAACH